jgi:hypothetical protein
VFVIAGALAASPATAQPVQYGTQYSFTGAPGSYLPLVSRTYTTAAGTVTVTFTGQPFTTVGSAGAISLGTVGVTGLLTADVTLPSPVIFLQLMQTAASAGVVEEDLGATVAAGQGLWDLTTVSSKLFDVGGRTYTIDAMSIGGDFGSAATIFGSLSVSTVPEPTTVGLMAVGLLELAFSRLRRRTSIRANPAVRPREVARTSNA